MRLNRETLDEFLKEIGADEQEKILAEYDAELDHGSGSARIAFRYAIIALAPVLAREERRFRGMGF